MNLRPLPVARQASLRSLAAVIEHRIKRSSLQAGAVLMYHDVTPASVDPRGRVAPPLGLDALRTQLLFLRHHYEVVSIHDLRRRVAERRPGEPFPVALTFDDDVESHSTLVAPLLRELGLPAAFFLTGASLDGPAAFWWHDLETVIQRGGRHTEELQAEVRRRWPAAGDELDPQLLARTIENLPADERDAVAERLRELADGPPANAGLDEAAVRGLHDAGFDIGFHTRRHYLTQALDGERLRAAMREGLDRLTQVLGHRPRAIAFPHCRPGDLRIATAAAEAGFELGFICNGRAVSAAQHPLLLERLDGWLASFSHVSWRLARAISQAYDI